MTIRNGPNDPTDRPRDPDGRFRDVYVDEKARKAATLATILAAIAGLIAIIALIYAFAHGHDFAPSNCSPDGGYVCVPEVVEETTTTDVPTTSMSPTEVPVPSATPSETVTTTVRP